MISTPAQQRTALHRIAAASRLLVALDFDGTLAPLQNEPMDARMLPASRAAVEALTRAPHTWVALVSGRSLVDLRLLAEHDDDSPVLLAGSHGAEYWFPEQGLVEPAEDPSDVALRDSLRTQAEQATAGLAGVWIEPKTFGLGVHTRRAIAEVAAAADARVDAIVQTSAPHWRRRTGHNIVEYSFRHEGKDTAVARLRQRVGASAALFAGDDTTDEDAIAALGPADLGIRVGDAPTAATLIVPDIPALAALLADLARLRSAGGARAGE